MKGLTDILEGLDLLGGSERLLFCDMVGREKGVLEWGRFENMYMACCGTEREGTEERAGKRAKGGHGIPTLSNNYDLTLDHSKCWSCVVGCTVWGE